MSQDKRAVPSQSPFRLATILGVSIFVIGFSLVFFFHFLLSVSPWVEAAVDSAVLSALLSPIVYFTVFRPLTRLIGEHEQAEAALQAAGDQLEARVEQRTAELQLRNRKLSLLAEMSDFLQACATAEEAYDVIAYASEQLFEETQGVLFVNSATGSELEAVATWGGVVLSPSDRVFRPQECWALRRGRMYEVEDSCAALPCRHSLSSPRHSSLCAPIVVRGEALGVLHVRYDRSTAEATRDAMELTRWVAAPLVEHIAWALANLRLRESLREESIRDPLTGLFNRRYMEETMEAEVQRAKRNQRPLGIVMFDLDHFKVFNDTYGHAAGDVVLRELGAMLMTQFRAGDIACRYGGEEFMLILPETSLESMRQRAEALRLNMKQLSVQHDGQQLGSVTLSAGVAVFPEHGAEGDALLRAADHALYRAKSEGRDRVVVAEAREAGLSDDQLSRD